jgi:hypothetical protein
MRSVKEVLERVDVRVALVETYRGSNNPASSGL